MALSPLQTRERVGRRHGTGPGPLAGWSPWHRAGPCSTSGWLEPAVPRGQDSLRATCSATSGWPAPLEPCGTRPQWARSQPRGYAPARRSAGCQPYSLAVPSPWHPPCLPPGVLITGGQTDNPTGLRAGGCHGEVAREGPHLCFSVLGTEHRAFTLSYIPALVLKPSLLLSGLCWTSTLDPPASASQHAGITPRTPHLALLVFAAGSRCVSRQDEGLGSCDPLRPQVAETPGAHARLMLFVVCIQTTAVPATLAAGKLQVPSWCHCP